MKTSPRARCCGSELNYKPYDHRKTNYCSTHALQISRAMKAYWTVVIPYVSSVVIRTCWHPTDAKHAPLTRGAFETELAAIRWARERLNGTPYSLRLVECDEVSIETAEGGYRG